MDTWGGGGRKRERERRKAKCWQTETTRENKRER